MDILHRCGKSIYVYIYTYYYTPHYLNKSSFFGGEEIPRLQPFFTRLPSFQGDALQRTMGDLRSKASWISQQTKQTFFNEMYIISKEEH